MSTVACSGSGSIPGSPDATGSGARDGGGGATGGSDGSTAGKGGSSGSMGGSAGGSANGGSGGVSGGDANTGADSGGATFRYVMNIARLPINRNGFAVDLNGDGQMDNQLGNIVNALSGQGINMQAEQDASTAAGQGLTLYALVTADAGFAYDPNATIDTYLALPTPSPDFSGAGTFMVDKSVPASQVKGNLTAGTFTPQAAPTGAPPTKTVVHLAFFGDVPIIGTQVTFVAATAASTLGQIDGAITKTDLDTVVVPNFAKRLDAIGKQNPCSSPCTQVLQIFDTDMNKTITTAEVASNSIIGALLAPDVDLLDASGNYAPSTTNADKDSLSIGVGFTAVKANFTP